MSAKSVFCVFVLAGLACAIVLPIVIVDVVRSIGPNIKGEEWAAWAQAIGSIIAVGAAAGIAVYQSQENKQQHADQRERKSYAARAVLPATLADLVNYTDECLNRLNTYLVNPNPDGSYPRFNVPLFPEKLVFSLKDCIEFAEDGPRERLAKLIEKLQIQNSRLDSLGLKNTMTNMITTKYDIFSSIVDTLEIRARVDMLFPYARRTSHLDPGEPGKSNVAEAANICRFADTDQVMKAIGRRYT